MESILIFFRIRKPQAPLPPTLKQRFITLLTNWNWAIFFFFFVFFLFVANFLLKKRKKKKKEMKETKNVQNAQKKSTAASNGGGASCGAVCGAVSGACGAVISSFIFLTLKRPQIPEEKIQQPEETFLKNSEEKFETKMGTEIRQRIAQPNFQPNLNWNFGSLSTKKDDEEKKPINAAHIPPWRQISQDSAAEKNSGGSATAEKNSDGSGTSTVGKNSGGSAAATKKSPPVPPKPKNFQLESKLYPHDKRFSASASAISKSKT